MPEKLAKLWGETLKWVGIIIISRAWYNFGALQLQVVYIKWVNFKLLSYFNWKLGIFEKQSVAEVKCSFGKSWNFSTSTSVEKVGVCIFEYLIGLAKL